MNLPRNSLLLILAAISCLVAGSPSGSLADVTLTMWFHSGRAEERKAISSVVAKFNKQQNGITVKTVQLPEGSYNEQIQAAALAGDLPDILDFDGPNVYNYAWSGYLIPLDGFITEEMKNDFLPSVMSQAHYNGKIYNLASFDSGLAIWGNRAYLEKAGVRIPKDPKNAWSHDEFLAALEKLKALPEVEYPIDFKMNYGVGEWFTYGFSPILQSYGADLIDRTRFLSADGILNGPAAVRAMTFLQNLFREKYARASQAGDDDFYGRKTAALSYVGHWMWAKHREALGDALVLLPMPRFGKRAITGMGSWTWGITANSKHPQEAWSLLNHLVSVESILEITNANGAVPARKKAIARSQLYGPDGPLRLFAQQLADGMGVPRPQTPAYPVITAAFSEAVQNIINGADIKDELDKAAEKIDQDIEDNRGYPAP